jgi:hypothetical protein
MEDDDEIRDESTGEPQHEEPRDATAEQQDPESSAASAPPPGQEPGEGKTHDL